MANGASGADAEAVGENRLTAGICRWLPSSRDLWTAVGEICEEFREIYKAIGGKKPYSVLKVGILNAWGKQRSWMCFMVAHELWYQQIYSYQGILESLSGQAVEVEFLSFEEIEGGVPKGIEVLINAGDAGTAFSGGEKWRNEKVQESVREYVYNGGGLIGVGGAERVREKR